MIETPPPPSDDPDARLLNALASLNQISGTINRIGSEERISSVFSLQLIVESAIRVVPGSSAIIYTYDDSVGKFDIESRVSSTDSIIDDQVRNKITEDSPRVNGIGVRTIKRRKKTLSYEEPDISIHPYHVNQGVKAVGCFPLIVAEQVVGVLYVYLRSGRAFSQIELLMLDNFVNQAAMAVFHARRLEKMRQDLLRKENELDRLHHASMLISSRLKLEETLESILKLALDMTNAHYGIFRLLDRNGENLVTHVFTGNDLTRPQLESLPVDMNSVMGQVACTREPLLISDLLAEPWSKIYYPLDVGYQMRSELAIPLINASGRLEGVLNLESPEPGSFTENHSHMLQTLSTYAVTAIQEVRLLDALQEVAKQIYSLPAKQVLKNLAQMACDLLNASSSAIWLLQESRLELEVSYGDHNHAEIIPIEGSLAGLAFKTREPVVAQDVRVDPRFFRQDLAIAQNWVRSLIIPLQASEDENPLGCIGVFSSSENSGRFAESDWDKKVLTFLAHYAVLTLKNENHLLALKASQEQRSIAETFAVVGDIASNILHNLNNKVGTIPVRIQTIQDKCASALKSDPYLSSNLIEIERCAIEAMQTVQLNIANLRPIELEEVQIAGCIKKAIDTAKLNKAIQIDITGIENLPVFYANKESLSFVFTNLIDNAVEAMNGSGKISITGRSISDFTEIAIRDSGPGIAPSLQEEIFTLNYTSISKKRPGKLGFGLWWVKTLITRLGGSIKVESDGQSCSTFIVKLPITRYL